METNFMYGLSWRLDGYGNGYGNILPQSATLAVSNDKEKLIKMMHEYVTKDCAEVKREDCEDDRENEEYNINFKVSADYGEMIVLAHRMNTELYARYEIVTYWHNK